LLKDLRTKLGKMFETSKSKSNQIKFIPDPDPDTGCKIICKNIASVHAVVGNEVLNINFTTLVCKIK